METHDYTEEAEDLMRLSLRSFCLSFTLGTILLVTYMVFKEIEVVVIGFLYVLMALLFNGIILVNNIIFLSRRGEKRSALLWRTLLLTLNIPIALWYTDIVFKNI